jgi:hypothetical protein
MISDVCGSAKKFGNPKMLADYLDEGSSPLQTAYVTTSDGIMEAATQFFMIVHRREFTTTTPADDSSMASLKG